MLIKDIHELLNEEEKGSDGIDWNLVVPLS